MNSHSRLPNSKHLSLDAYAILIPVLISLLSYFFIYHGFATSDSVRYALDLNTLSTKGISEINNCFNAEQSFGYYLFLLAITKSFPNVHDISAIMNIINWIFSTIMIAFLFAFARSLYNMRIALYTCIFIILAPSIWFLSHYGHPELVALTLYVISLFIIDKLFTIGRFSLLYCCLLTIICTCALSMRLDIALSAGVFFALLLFYHNTCNYKSTFIAVISSLILSLLCVLFIRYLVLGYVLPPGGGTIGFHLTSRVSTNIHSLLKNASLWMLGSNAIIIVLALIALPFLQKNEALLLIASLAPYLLLLLLRATDTARAIAPSIIVPTLLAVVFLERRIFSGIKRKHLTFVCFIIVTQLFAAGIYYPVTHFYNFKVAVERRYLATFPIGFILTDHLYRQEWINKIQEVADAIADEKEGNILIVDMGGHQPYYVYASRRSLRSLPSEKEYSGIVLTEYKDTYKTVYICDPSFNYGRHIRLKDVCAIPVLASAKVHVTPFSTLIDPNYSSLYFEKEMFDPDCKLE